MSLANTDKKEVKEKGHIEGKLFDLFLVTVIVGFPCLLTFLTWRFWGAGMQ